MEQVHMFKTCFHFFGPPSNIYFLQSKTKVEKVENKALR